MINRILNFFGIVFVSKKDMDKYDDLFHSYIEKNTEIIIKQQINDLYNQELSKELKQLNLYIHDLESILGVR